MRVWKFDRKTAFERLTEEEKQKIISEADQISRGEISFKGRWDMEQCPTIVKDPGWHDVLDGDQEYLYQHNRHTSFLTLAVAYALTEEKRYLETFLSLITSWMDECPLNTEAEKDVWRSLEAGLRPEIWLLSLDLFGTSIPEQTKERIIGILHQHGELLVRSYGTFHKLSNWGVLQDAGLYALGIFFEKEDWISLSVQRLDANAENSIMSDGSHWEQSPMYTGEVLSSFLCVVNLAEQHGRELPSSLLERTHHLAKALAYFMKKDGKLYTYGDSDLIDARDLIAFSALLFKDPYLKAKADGDGMMRIAFRCTKGQIADYIALEATKSPNRSHALPDSGNYFLNKGPLETHFATGTMGSGHGHADNLSLSVAWNGEDVLTDPGRYTYKDTEERRTLKSASSHNTFIVDCREFSEPNGTWDYKDIALPLASFHRFTPTIDYAEGSHLGYPDAFCKRSILRIGEKMLLLFDTVKYEGFHTVKTGFNFAKGYEITLHEESGRADFSSSATHGTIVFSGHPSMKLKPVPFSMHYNSLEKSVRLISKSDFTDRCVNVTAVHFGQEAFCFETGPLHLASQNREIPLTDAVAVHVNIESKDIVVFYCEKECIGPVDLYTAFGKEGYGRVIVFAGEKKQVMKY